MKVLFTCGGTAGHINPALSVASALQDAQDSCEVLFIGAENNMEMDLVPREGYEICAITITNLSRDLSPEGFKHNLQTARNVLHATAEAKKIIRSFSPDIVVGTGGYVCFPVITAAHQLGIPAVIHESNALPGLTTKMLARVADRILVGFEDSRNAYHDPSLVEVTGTPVRGAFYHYTKDSAREELGISEEEKVVVSVWGSLGAAYMNEMMLSLIPMLRQGEMRLIHCTGKRYYKDFMDRLRSSAPDYARRGIEVREYIHDMPRVMTAADLILCRAGASTLSELTFMGKPSFLVPSPNVTNNHQEKNARLIERAGGAKVFLEGRFTAEELLGNIRSTLCDASLCKKMGENSASLSYRDAADNISRILIELASNS